MHPGSIPGEASNPSRHFRPRAPSSGRSRNGEPRMTTNWLEQRLRMVNGQLRTSDVTDMSVLAAFLEVPRERFVAPALMNLAYVDQDLPAAGATDGRRLLAPRTLALLLQAAATGLANARSTWAGAPATAPRFSIISALPWSRSNRIGARRSSPARRWRDAPASGSSRATSRRARAGGAVRRHTRQRRFRDDAERVAGPTRRGRSPGRRRCAHEFAARRDHRQSGGRVQRALAVRRQGRCPRGFSAGAGLRVLNSATSGWSLGIPTFTCVISLRSSDG